MDTTAKKQWWIAIATFLAFCLNVAVFLYMLNHIFAVSIIAMVPLGFLAARTFVQFSKAWKLR